MNRVCDVFSVHVLEYSLVGTRRVITVCAMRYLCVGRYLCAPGQIGSDWKISLLILLVSSYLAPSRH